MTPMRHHWPDEEPDVDEAMLPHVIFDLTECGEFCERCGVEGHEGEDCPTIVPALIMRRIADGEP